MPRGCDNPRSRFNNAPSVMPWTWLPCEWMGTSDDLITAWKSTRHDLRVVREGGSFFVANGGKHLRGRSNRRRRFKSAISAQFAADIEMGVA